jgi:hypothetical protein
MEEGFTAPSALRQKQTAAQCRLLIPQLLDFIRTLQTDGFELARTLAHTPLFLRHQLWLSKPDY